MAPVRIAVLQHESVCPPAGLGGWLEEAGAQLQVVRPDLGEDLAPLRTADAVLVLGGTMGAEDHDVAPWLPELKTILAECVGRTPVLGVCLGHQVLASALGGAVEKNPRGQRVGVRRAYPAAAAAADPLLSAWAAGRESVPVVQWNDDVVVRAPEGTVVLATDADGDLLAARYADRVWGVQWHPEADDAVVSPWAEGDADRHRTQGLDVEALRAEIRDRTPELVTDGRLLAEAFVRCAAEARR